jgi:hypothetical protein
MHSARIALNASITSTTLRDGAHHSTRVITSHLSLLCTSVTTYVIVVLISALLWFLEPVHKSDQLLRHAQRLDAALVQAGGTARFVSRAECCVAAPAPRGPVRVISLIPDTVALGLTAAGPASVLAPHALR